MLSSRCFVILLILLLAVLTTHSRRCFHLLADNYPTCQCTSLVLRSKRGEKSPTHPNFLNLDRIVLLAVQIAWRRRRATVTAPATRSATASASRTSLQTRTVRRNHCNSLPESPTHAILMFSRPVVLQRLSGWLLLKPVHW